MKDSAKKDMFSSNDDEKNVEALKKPYCRQDDYNRNWLAKLDELAKYKLLHGDCNVPVSFPLIGRWVRQFEEKKNELIIGKAYSYFASSEQRQVLTLFAQLNRFLCSTGNEATQEIPAHDGQ
jgi:hypothetical protein